MDAGTALTCVTRFGLESAFGHYLCIHTLRHTSCELAETRSSVPTINRSMASDVLASPVGQESLQRAIVLLERQTRVTQQPKATVILDASVLFEMTQKQ
jgi:hypothetical protein